MAAQLLMLPLVVIAGASFGVIVGRVLSARAPQDEMEPLVIEPVPIRQLDAVLAPYEHVAA